MGEREKKNFLVELEVSGKILTRESASDEEGAILVAESRDYLSLPENVEDSDVEINAVDVEKIKENL